MTDPRKWATGLSEDVVDSNYDEEFRQFLEADLLPETADPVFKARLREALLAMLRAGQMNASGGISARAGQVDGVPQPAAPGAPDLKRESS